MQELLQGKHFDVVIDKIAYCSNDIRYVIYMLIVKNTFICRVHQFIILNIWIRWSQILMVIKSILCGVVEKNFRMRR